MQAHRPRQVTSATSGGPGFPVLLHSTVGPTERAALSARGRQIETEAVPIRYVAELMGADTDSERAIRYLIALMVLCRDPLAIALTAAASARR